MDDEAILASVGSEPDAFAVFYDRHARRLLNFLAGRMEDPQQAGDLCAETFAAALARAHAFDPERETPAAWLDGISRRLLARAERRRGVVDDRYRRRLGIAPLDLPDRAGRERFIRDLEEELVEAARFRAARRRRRPAMPRVRGAPAAAAGLGLVALAAALALGRGDDPDRAVDARRATPPGGTVALPPMLATADCRGVEARKEPSAELLPDIGVVTYQRNDDDALSRELTGPLPLATLDPREPRVAGARRLRTRLHVVPSLGVSSDASCVPDDGPGVCLVVEQTRSFRCFPIAAVRAGRALTLTPHGPIVGIVPDGIGRVTVTAGDRTASPRVYDNVYEVQLEVPTGARVRVELTHPGAGGCERAVSPELLARVATLRREPEQGFRLPQAGLERLREESQLDAVVEEGARFWGGGDGVEFWAVPVVLPGAKECAPADGVCVVAIPEDDRADAECGLRPGRDLEHWRLAPLLPENAGIYGTVPDGVTGARVTFRTLTAQVEARDNVVGGVLPFPWVSGMRVELVRRPQPEPPTVGVVDATGVPGVAATSSAGSGSTATRPSTRSRRGSSPSRVRRCAGGRGGRPATRPRPSPSCSGSSRCSGSRTARAPPGR
jgi:RNA polymerase sigma-70 factor (ECF subfamily)